MKNLLLTMAVWIMFPLIHSAFAQYSGGAGDGADQNTASAITLNDSAEAMTVTVPTLTEWGVIMLIAVLAIAAGYRVRKLGLGNSVS